MIITDDPTNSFVTQWGDYQILVHVSCTLTGPLNGQFNSTYQILQDEKVLTNGYVSAKFDTCKNAAENVLRIAKIDARGTFSGPFPDDEIL